MELQTGDLQWTPVEKTQLLAALRRHGAQNLNALHAALPGRSLIDIRRTLDYYQERAWGAAHQPDTLRQWLEVMLKMDPERPGLVPRALKYIALFEERASGADVDLSALYLYLSQLCCQLANTSPAGGELQTLHGALQHLLQQKHTAQLRARLQQLSAPGHVSPLDPLGLR